jgi:hypothetical protein
MIVPNDATLRVECPKCHTVHPYKQEDYELEKPGSPTIVSVVCSACDARFLLRPATAEAIPYPPMWIWPFLAIQIVLMLLDIYLHTLITPASTWVQEKVDVSKYVLALSLLVPGMVGVIFTNPFAGVIWGALLAEAVVWLWFKAKHNSDDSGEVLRAEDVRILGHLITLQWWFVLSLLGILVHVPMHTPVGQWLPNWVSMMIVYIGMHVATGPFVPPRQRTGFTEWILSGATTTG